MWCRRMFDSAVAVGLYHKSDNTIDINPDETKVFAADDQIVALSTSGNPGCRLPGHSHCSCGSYVHSGLTECFAQLFGKSLI